MLYRLLHWLLVAVAFLLTSHLLPGFRVTSFASALIAAIVLAVLNATVWWLLFIFTLPLNLLTIGLFTFVINGLVLSLAAALVPGIQVNGLGTAIIASIIISILSWGLGALFLPSHPGQATVGL